MPLDLAILQILHEQVPARPPFGGASFTHVAREEDPNNYFLTVKAVGKHEGVEVLQDFHTRLRIKPTVCDTCQRQDSRYYEGILQVRADGRELTGAERREVRTLVLARADRGREEAGDFVSRVEEVRGGLDFYVSSNALGGRLAKEIASAYGGTVSSSAKLYGQRKGKDMYRVTSLVRLPAFRVGDIVRYRDALTEVVALAPLLTLRDLVSGEARRYKPRDVRRARRVEAERFQGPLEQGPRGRLVATHPESGAQRSIRTQGVRGSAAISIVWTADAAYVSSLSPEVSKP